MPFTYQSIEEAMASFMVGDTEVRGSVYKDSSGRSVWGIFNDKGGAHSREKGWALVLLPAAQVALSGFKTKRVAEFVMREADDMYNAWHRITDAADVQRLAPKANKALGDINRQMRYRWGPRSPGDPWEDEGLQYIITKAREEAGLGPPVFKSTPRPEKKKKAKAGAKTFTIQTDAGPIEVKGYVPVPGVWGISKPTGYGQPKWAVTHIPTGLRVLGQERLNDARAAVRLLNSLPLPWSSSNKSDLMVPEVGTLARAISKHGPDSPATKAAAKAARTAIAGGPTKSDEEWSAAVVELEGSRGLRWSKDLTAEEHAAVNRLAELGLKYREANKARGRVALGAVGAEFIKRVDPFGTLRGMVSEIPPTKTAQDLHAAADALEGEIARIEKATQLGVVGWDLRKAVERVFGYSVDTVGRNPINVADDASAVEVSLMDMHTGEDFTITIKERADIGRWILTMHKGIGTEGNVIARGNGNTVKEAIATMEREWDT
jgi:hypothetical protein